MREPENCSMYYCGFEAPRDSEEMEFEILGLQNLIKRAEERITMLRQSTFLANLAINNESKDLQDFFSKESYPNDNNSGVKKE
jgi:hypothetical protein